MASSVNMEIVVFLPGIILIPKFIDNCQMAYERY